MIAARRVCLLTALFASTLVCNRAVAQQVSVELTDKCSVFLASSKIGKQRIVAKDAYTSRMQPAEIRIRMKTNDPKTVDDYKQVLQAGVKAFTDEESQKLVDVITELKPRLAAYDLPLPEKIHLIRVSKEVEFDAPHCRGASIVLPDSYFGNAERMSLIFAHELFHVLSSHNPELRDKLYSIIGFSKCNEIALPAELEKRRLTNPDASIHQHVIQVTIDDEKVHAVPVTMIRSSKYDGGGLMKYLEFQLMIVEKDGVNFVAKLKDDRPWLVPPSRSADFAKQIGRNTGYIIHPEETLADNFWMMVLGRPDLPDAWIIDEMKMVLAK